MGADVAVDEHSGLLRVGNIAPFSVKEKDIWPYLHRPGKCWYATDAGDQGEGILEGVYTDYIVDDLFNNDFKYNRF